MSGTVEQNTSYIPSTIGIAAATSTSMSQLQTKAVQQYSVGYATSATTDWVIFKDIVIPTVSGVYAFTSNNNINGGDNSVNLTQLFIVQIMNTQMYVKAYVATNRGRTQQVYFILKSVATTSSTYNGSTAGVALPLPSTDYYVPFVNGISGLTATQFSCTISRIG